MKLIPYAAAFIAIAFMLALASSCSCEPCKYKTVKTIGGCAHDGLCGVMWEDGTFGLAGYPVVGKQVCIW